MNGIRMTDYGDPSVMKWVGLPDLAPGPDEVLVDVQVAGVNYIDTYHRTGFYPVELPFTPGVEGAGVVAAVGSDIDLFEIGDRVAWTGRTGSYASRALVHAEDAVRVPEDVSLEDAVGVTLQGLTAHYLATSTWPLEPGQRCLVHAGAGGVGGLLIQIAKRRGAEVFATAGGADKTAIAAATGADHAIDYEAEDFVAAVERIAGPRPLDVVFDGVGAATVRKGLGLLRARGLMATYGNASGPVPPIDVLDLSRNGSLFITRPTSAAYLRTRQERLDRHNDLFSWLEDGTLQVRIGARYPMSDAVEAHVALEERRTTGKLVLLA